MGVPTSADPRYCVRVVSSGLPVFPLMSKHVWNPHGVSEVVILGLGLDSFNGSSYGPCEKGMLGRGKGSCTHRATAALCVCDLCTVSEWSIALISPQPGTCWESWIVWVCLTMWFQTLNWLPGLYFFQWIFLAESGLRRKRKLQLENIFFIK